MSSKNKTIAFNSIIIYLRIFITSIIGLLTTRYVLQILGAENYGLFNVVGSVIVMLNCISTAMYTTTRRYINIEMGKSNGNLNKIFNISFTLHIGFALLILLICESVGLWYINNHLNVAPEKLADANFIFQITTIVSCIGIMNVPYQGLIEAFEKFWQTAIIDIINAFFKIIIVIILINYTGNNALRFYAVLTSLLTFSSFILYQIACYIQWKDIIKFKIYTDKNLYKEILIFNNYTALGAISYLARSQGSNILVNFFFGTAVNAAFAIAYQIQNFVQIFIGNLGTASAPQITQSYSKGDKMKSFNLVSNINRYTILMMILIYYTLNIRLDYILSIWLGTPPDNTLILCSWILKYALCHSFLTCLSTYIQASGKLKWFQVSGFILELSLIPLGYLFFQLGYPPVTIIIILTIIMAINIVLYLCLMYKILKFNSLSFIRKAFLRPIFVLIIMSFWLITSRSFCIHPFILITLTGIISLLVIYIIGLNNYEQKVIQGFFLKYVDKYHNRTHDKD